MHSLITIAVNDLIHNPGKFADLVIPGLEGLFKIDRPDNGTQRLDGEVSMFCIKFFVLFREENIIPD